MNLYSPSVLQQLRTVSAHGSLLWQAGLPVCLCAGAKRLSDRAEQLLGSVRHSLAALDAHCRQLELVELLSRCDTNNRMK